MKEHVYKYNGRWYYANRKGDPPVPDSLCPFLDMAAKDTTAEIEIDIRISGTPFQVRCNSLFTVNQTILDDLEALDSFRYADSLVS